MTRNLVASAAAICGLTAQVFAQSALPIAVDQRVRVWTSSPAAITGRVTSMNAGGFEVTEEGRVPVSIARVSVQRLEVSRGRKSPGAAAARGALWGAIIAGAAGAVLAALQHEQVGEDGSSVGKAAALGAWSGGLFGGLIGAGIGAARAGETWEQVWP
jgi:Flp pilus assembly protein TadG